MPEMEALKSRGERYQKEMVRYDTEYLHGVSIRYQTILALPLSFPREIEISAKCQVIHNIYSRFLFKKRIMSAFLGLMLLFLVATTSPAFENNVSRELN